MPAVRWHRRGDAGVEDIPVPAAPGRRANTALTVHKARQVKERRAVGEAWHDNNLVFYG
jgi:hypothetical protein